MIGRDGFAFTSSVLASTKRAKPLITSTFFYRARFHRKYEYGRYRRYGCDQRFPVEFIDSGIETIIRTYMWIASRICAACHITFFGTHRRSRRCRPVLWLQSARISDLHSRAVDGGDTAAAAADGDVS